MVTEIKLLPCPFCGGEVKIDMLDSENSRNVKIYSAVHCPKCHEWFFKGLSKEKTIAAWNRRVDARQLALKTRVCPMCEDCPDGCPVETPEDSRNVVTNADRIRSMSGEELAEFLDDEPPYFATYKQYIDWLRKPIESEVEHDA